MTTAPWSLELVLLSTGAYHVGPTGPQKVDSDAFLPFPQGLQAQGFRQTPPKIQHLLGRQVFEGGGVLQVVQYWPGLGMDACGRCWGIVCCR